MTRTSASFAMGNLGRAPRPTRGIGRRATTGLLAALLLVSIGNSWSLAPAVYAGHALGSSAAPGGPGADSYFDLARKDCVGTAVTPASKVWFTVADGALSDVYYPTVDNTNVGSLQLVVTNGRTYTDLQQRDTTYTVRRPDGPVPDCEVTATAKSGAYRFTEDFLTDPSHDSVVIRVRFTSLKVGHGPFHLYLWFDPTINGNGGGGTVNAGADTALTTSFDGRLVAASYDRNTTSEATNRTYAQPVYAALTTSATAAVADGFVGTPSDGLGQLDRYHRLTRTYGSAVNGNVAQAVGIKPGVRDFTIALGFGRDLTAAERESSASVSRQFHRTRAAYVAGWRGYDRGLRRPAEAPARVSRTEWRRLTAEYYLSANVLKVAEDKTFAGAIVASLTAPWGQAVPADTEPDLYYSGYREVWARDLYEMWTALMLDGDRKTAAQALGFLFFRQQQPDGSFPRNSLLNGLPSPDSTGVQLDECSYPLIMAEQMGWHGRRFYERHIKPDANFIIANGPSEGVERWEDQTGYSPSTIAAEIAGLTAAASVARENHDEASAAIWQGVANEWQRSIDSWTVTTNGPLSRNPYFIRLSKEGDPNQGDEYDLGNGAGFHDQRAVVDQGFLELVRLGDLSPKAPIIQHSLHVVDRSNRHVTPDGPGWLRYTADGYGDQAGTGAPWVGAYVGTGHPWPVLTGERAEYDLASGQMRRAQRLLETMDRMSFGVGLMPEQIWDGKNLPASPYGTAPATASIGFRDGQADGSATPLSWAEGQYIRLFLDVGAGKVLERPAATTDRYVLGSNRPTRLTVRVPADQASVNQSKIWVSGQSARDATIYVSAANLGITAPARVFRGRSSKSGRFAFQIRLTSGASILTIVAVGPHGGTSSVQRTVFWD